MNRVCLLFLFACLLLSGSLSQATQQHPCKPALDSTFTATVAPHLASVEKAFEQIVKQHSVFEIPAEKVLAVLDLVAHNEAANSVEEDIAQYAAQYFGLPRNEITLTTPQVAARGLSKVFFVNHGSKKLGVVKIFANHPDELVREVLSLAMLRDANLPAFHPVRAFDVSKITFENSVQGLLLMENATGTEMEILRRRIQGLPSDAATDLALLKHSVTLTAKGLAEMHARFKLPKPSAATDLYYTEYEQKMLLKIQDFLEPLVAEKVLTPEQFQAACKGIQEISAAFPTMPRGYSLIHGDAHLANFLAQDGASHVQLIDTEKFLYSTAGASDPLTDLGRLVASIEFGMKRGLLPKKELRALQKNAIQSYISERKKFGDATVDMSTLNFHILRFYRVLLSNKALETPLRNAIARRILEIFKIK